MGRFHVTFDDWSGGHYGTLDPRMVRKGMWGGTNMVVYDDGTIGPRPGLFEATLDDPPTGQCWGVHYTPVTGKELVGVWQDTVYRAALSSGTLTFTAIGTLNAEPTDFVVFEAWDPTLIYLVSVDDAVYKIDLDAGTVAAIADAPGGRCLRRFKERLYVGGDPTDVPYRVEYSAALSSGDTFNSATQTFDVGFWYEAYTMQVLRDRLLIGLQGDGWWSFTGTPSAGSIRQVLASLSPDKDRAVVKDDLDRIWYFPQQPQRGLVVTNGGTWDADTYEHLKLPSGDVHGAFSFGDRDILYIDDQTTGGLWRSHGAWSELTFAVPTQTNPPCITRWSSDMFAVAHDDGDTSTVIGFIQCGMSRPAFTTDDYAATADPGGAFDAYLLTPEWVAPAGQECQVTAVAVDFVAYDWDESATNATLDCQVNARNLREGGTEESSGQTFSVATSAVSTTGTRYRQVFGAGDQGWSPSFQIKLTPVGCKIISVTVEGSTRAQTPGGA